MTTCSCANTTTMQIGENLHCMNCGLKIETDSHIVKYAPDDSAIMMQDPPAIPTPPLISSAPILEEIPFNDAVILPNQPIADNLLSSNSDQLPQYSEPISTQPLTAEEVPVDDKLMPVIDTPQETATSSADTPEVPRVALEVSEDVVGESLEQKLKPTLESSGTSNLEQKLQERIEDEPTLDPVVETDILSKSKDSQLLTDEQLSEFTEKSSDDGSIGKLKEAKSKLTKKVVSKEQTHTITETKDVKPSFVQSDMSDIDKIESASSSAGYTQPIDTKSKFQSFELGDIVKSKLNSLSNPFSKARKIDQRDELIDKIQPLKLAMAAVSLLLLIAYIWQINYPSIALRIASSRSGISISSPNYLPSGWGVGRNFIAEQGKITFNLVSSSDREQLAVSQFKTSWDNQSLIDNYVSNKSIEYSELQTQGLTIFVYNKNQASWINNGVWYRIEGDNYNLTRDEILKIAVNL